MGQKVNPHGLRVGVIKEWDTQWYASKKDVAAYLKEDYVIRTYLKKQYYAAAISKIVIERAAQKITITVYTARPGVLIGKQGAEIEVMKKAVAKLTNAQGDRHQHRRDQKAGCGCAAGRRIHCGAARKARFVQKGDEAVHRQNHAFGRQGRQGHGCRAVWAARKSRAASIITKASIPLQTHPCGHRLRFCGSAHHLSA